MHRYLSEGTAVTLPVPLFNVLNGGQHALGGVDFQEFMLAPIGAPSFPEAVRWGAEAYQALASLLRERGERLLVGDEGGFAPALTRNEEAIELLLRAIERAGYRPGADIWLALDPAASSFYHEGRYELHREGTSLQSEALVERYADWVERYPIFSIEDGLAEDDWDGWELLAQRIGHSAQLVGDDIFVTNPSIIERGIAHQIANAVLIKPNQIGTLSETRQAIEITRAAGWQAVMSHRSGETDDSTIADLAVGFGASQMKAGAPARGERLAKYNRLIEIARDLGDQAGYAGTGVLRSPSAQDSHTPAS